MKNTTNVAVNAIALSCAMRIDDALLDAWGHGCVELYEDIAYWADLVTAEEGHLKEALAGCNAGWPGVFAYEVTESVGADLAVLIRGGYEVMKRDVVNLTRSRVADFCRDEEKGFEVWERYNYLAHAV